jgi:hypothetical protein
MSNHLRLDSCICINPVTKKMVTGWQAWNDDEDVYCFDDPATPLETNNEALLRMALASGNADFADMVQWCLSEKRGIMINDSYLEYERLVVIMGEVAEDTQ